MFPVMYITSYYLIYLYLLNLYSNFAPPPSLLPFLATHLLPVIMNLFLFCYFHLLVLLYRFHI